MSTPLANDDISDDCPFCGTHLLDRPGIAEMLHQAHDRIEALAVAERGSDEFEFLLDAVRGFVGVWA